MTLAVARVDAKPTPSLAKLAQARVDAAADVFGRVEKAWQGGTDTLDEVCTWSARWYQAQRDQPLKGAALAAAADAHLARVQAIETLVTQRVQAGVETDADSKIVAYYRAEAELWAAQVRTK